MSKVTIRANDLTLGEIEDVEEASGQPAGRWLAGGDVSAKVLTGLAWVVLRRDDEDYTYEKARTLKVSDIDFDRSEDPTDGGSSGSVPPSATSGE